MKVTKYLLTAKPTKRDDLLVLIYESLYHTILPVMLTFIYFLTGQLLFIALIIPIVFIRIKVTR